MPTSIPVKGVKTLSELQIDTDKDWKAHGIYNLGDLTPKVDGAYNIGDSATQFDTVYGSTFPGTTFLSNTQIDADKDWKARSIYNLGDLTPKVDGAYSLGSPTAQFDTAYAHNIPGAAPLITEPTSNAASDLDSVRDIGSGALSLQNLLAVADGADVVYQPEMTSGTAASMFDSVNLTVSRAADIAYQPELQPVKAASIFDNANLTVSRAADIAYQPELQPVKAASIFDNANLTVSRAADIAYQPELQPVKFGDIFDHPNLGSAKAKDIVYHGNFNLGTTEARDKVAASAYGMASDLVGVKGLSKQVTEKKDFVFRTETPNHAYWHRMYNTPAAFETVYQDYTTSMQKKGTTPSKSAPGTADPNPQQPGACWSVAQIPDGAQTGGFAPPTASPTGITWDGTYLWYAEDDANYVYQLETDGTQVGGFTPPSTPHGVAWDGAYFWITSGIGGARYIYQLKSDGTQVSGFPSPGNNTQGLAWDGIYLWNIDNASACIYKLKPDGTQVDIFAAPGPNPRGIGWDGTYLWHTDTDADTIYQWKPDGTEVSNFASPGGYPWDVPWDGKYLWNSDSTAGYIYQLGNAGNFDVNYRIFAK